MGTFPLQLSGTGWRLSPLTAIACFSDSMLACSTALVPLTLLHDGPILERAKYGHQSSARWVRTVSP
jgi:hypothetical protein